MTNKLILLLILICFASPAASETYSWADENGVTNFTDDYAKIPQKFRKKTDISSQEDSGLISSPPSRSEFSELLNRAHNGDVDAQALVGRCYYLADGVKRNLKEAYRWTKMAADQGNALAQFRLSGMYHKGEFVKKDDRESFSWSIKAARQGLALAQFIVGNKYNSGEGVQKNEVESFKWMKMAAEQGYQDAQKFVSFQYATGKGTSVNKEEAAKWALKVAEKGDGLTQYYLGSCYTVGVGVPKDYIIAYKWLRIASLGKNDTVSKSLEILNKLKSVMTESQVAAAEKLALDWIQQH